MYKNKTRGKCYFDVTLESLYHYHNEAMQIIWSKCENYVESNLRLIRVIIDARIYINK